MRFWGLLIILVCAGLVSSESFRKRCKRVKTEKMFKVVAQSFCSWYKAKFASKNETSSGKLAQSESYAKSNSKNESAREKKAFEQRPISKKNVKSNYELHWNDLERIDPLILAQLNESLSNWIWKHGKKHNKKHLKHTPAYVEHELAKESLFPRAAYPNRLRRRIEKESTFHQNADRKKEIIPRFLKPIRLSRNNRNKVEEEKMSPKSNSSPQTSKSTETGKKTGDNERQFEKEHYGKLSKMPSKVHKLTHSSEPQKLKHKILHSKPRFTEKRHMKKKPGRIFKRSVDISHEKDSNDEEDKIYFNFTSPGMSIWDVLFNPGKYRINPAGEEKFNLTILDSGSNETKSELTSNTEEFPEDMWEEISWIPEVTDAPEFEVQEPETTTISEIPESQSDGGLVTSTILNVEESSSDIEGDDLEDLREETNLNLDVTEASTVRTQVEKSSPILITEGLSEEVSHTKRNSTIHQTLTSAAPIMEVQNTPQNVRPTVRTTLAPGKTTDRQRQYVRIGSIKGIPGIHFPNYHDIPFTSFSCSNKKIPGYYADMETSCQVFHVCFQNRKASFLCPVGTIFNQALLTCDYWYSSNCSLTNHYATLEKRVDESKSQTRNPDTKSTVQISTAKSYENNSTLVLSNLRALSKFLPVKAKITVYPPSGEKRPKVVAFTSVGDKRKDRKDGSQRVTGIKNKSKGSVPATPQKEIDPKVNQIIKDAFEIARQVLGEVGSLFPRRSAVKPTTVKTTRRPTKRPTSTEVRKTSYTRGKPWALPTLNPRFIVKPLYPTKSNTSKQEFLKSILIPLLDDRLNIRRS